MDEQLYLLIGELKAGQSAVRSSIESLTEATSALGKKVNTLPCVSHADDLETLMEWKKSCNGAALGRAIETHKGNISLKNGVILIVVTALATGLATRLVEWLSGIR